MGSGGRAIGRRNVNQGDVVVGSIPPIAVSKLRPTFAGVFRVSEERLKTGGPFYLVSMPGPGGVKDPIQGVNVAVAS